MGYYGRMSREQGKTTGGNDMELVLYRYWLKWGLSKDESGLVYAFSDDDLKLMLRRVLEIYEIKDAVILFRREAK